MNAPATLLTHPALADRDQRLLLSARQGDLDAYEALRPRRSTFAELEELAQRLADRDAPTCAALVREAATAYQRRGLLR